MSVEALEVREILPGVFRWECFSPEHKVELTSHAVLVDEQFYIFDPIPLAPVAQQRLLNGRPVAAIVLTNENHERAVESWRAVTQAPVWTMADVVMDVHHWAEGQKNWGPWEIVPLAGGAGGEIALRWRACSLVVLGDALFNLPKYGFGLLPEKYCRNQGALKKALLGLTDESFEIALLAHGDPLITEASGRIQKLIRG